MALRQTNSLEDQNNHIVGAILDAVNSQDTPASPADIINQLTERDFRKSIIRTVLWHLIAQDQIELTSDWKLVVESPKSSK